MTSSLSLVEQNMEADVHISNYEERWTLFKDNKNFFDHVEIARDGGFSEVNELTGVSRYFASLMVVCFTGLNIYYILSVNLPFVLSSNTSSGGFFTIIKSYILKPICSWAGTLNVDNLPDLMVIGILEIVLLTWQVAVLVRRLITIARAREKFIRWHAVQSLFWTCLPYLSTVSGLKLLNFVTPAVLLPSLNAILGHILNEPKNFKHKWNLVYFVLSRAFLGLVGFDVFLFKMQIVSAKFVEGLDETTGEPKEEGNTLNLILLAMSFLNQLLGIVQLGWFVRVRIFEFIFAGEDGLLSNRERAIKETWEAMLAMKIWEEKTFTWYQKFAVYFSYSDVDFQKLALDPKGKKRDKAHSAASAQEMS